MADLKALIRDIPDFPKPGVMFKDITPLLGDPEGLQEIVALVAAPWRSSSPTKVLGIEARGFILAAPIAVALGAGFVPARKSGKLPWQTVSVAYELEYGAERIEVHADAIHAGDRVVIVDDVLATGGTAMAAVTAVRRLGAQPLGVGVAIELEFLEGRKRLTGVRVESVLSY